MLRGIGYLVADRGDRDASSETAVCLALSGWAGRMLRRFAPCLPSAMRRLLHLDRPKIISSFHRNSEMIQLVEATLLRTETVSHFSWNCPRTEPSAPGFRGQRKTSVRLSYALGDRLCQGFGRA